MTPVPALRLPAEVAALQFFVPREGETLVDYRERVVPVVQAAVAPQRTRVARMRDEFFDAADLDTHQREELDAAVREAADGIQNRVLEGLATGELLPPRLRPSSAIAFLRDLLDFVVKADRRFRASLTDEQIAALDDGHFDVADYLLFSVYWEEMLQLF